MRQRARLRSKTFGCCWLVEICMTSLGRGWQRREVEREVRLEVRGLEVRWVVK